MSEVAVKAQKLVLKTIEYIWLTLKFLIILTFLTFMYRAIQAIQYFRAEQSQCSYFCGTLKGKIIDDSCFCATDLGWEKR